MLTLRSLPASAGILKRPRSKPGSQNNKLEFARPPASNYIPLDALEAKRKQERGASI